MMDKSLQFSKNRENYKEFYYNKYVINEDEEAIYLEFEFEIPGLIRFNPTTKILKKKMDFKSINSNCIKNMVFHIGLIELISYWKSTCSPKIIIKCGHLNEEQIEWWKKTYFYGLAELFYTNNIKTNIKDFVTIECTSKDNNIEVEAVEENTNGYIVPIGGGKDSVVTLETLKLDKSSDYCFFFSLISL